MTSIYTINLERRNDRWSEAVANYSAHGLPPEAVRRWPAVVDDDFGALGCAKSHVAALAHYLTQESSPYCLIMEDDFDFIRPWSELVANVDQLAQQRIDWDVLMLTGTAVVAGPPQAPGVARLFEAQSAAAYLVQRRYAARILACFADGIAQMEEFRALRPREFITMRLATDQSWKPLQRRDRWYIFSPSFGRQRTSYSDIEQKTVNYDVLTYGLPQPAEPEQ